MGTELDKLSRRDAYECYQYAFNSLFLNPRFSEHLLAAGIEREKAIVFAMGITEDLQTFAEQHAQNMLRRKIFSPEERRGVAGSTPEESLSADREAL